MKTESFEKKATKELVKMSLKSSFGMLLAVSNNLEDITYEEHQQIQELLDEVKDLFKALAVGQMEVLP